MSSRCKACDSILTYEEVIFDGELCNKCSSFSDTSSYDEYRE